MTSYNELQSEAGAKYQKYIANEISLGDYEGATDRMHAWDVVARQLFGDIRDICAWKRLVDELVARVAQGQGLDGTAWHVADKIRALKGSGEEAATCFCGRRIIKPGQAWQHVPGPRGEMPRHIPRPVDGQEAGS